MTYTELAAQNYALAVKLWYSLMPSSTTIGGHPGIPGPVGAITEEDEPWTPTRGHLEGTSIQLKQILRHLGEDV
jgi:hypothetical protein